MRSLGNLRRQALKVAAKLMAQPPVRRQLSSQAKLGTSFTDLAQLQVAHVDPIQDIDPGSDTFGLFYYMVDYDAVDDPNHPIL